MPDQLQLRGGTTSEHNSFTGAAREVTVDTTKKTVVVHDGSTAGGTALMKESGGNSASTVAIGSGGTNALSIDASQDITFTGASANAVWDKSDNALEFADNAKCTFGDSDLSIFHDGTYSRIQDSSTNFVFDANRFTINKPGSPVENIFDANSNGAVTLYYDDNAKLATHANGVHLSGSMYLPDSQIVGFGDISNPDLRIYHNGSDSYIDSATGNFALRTTNAGHISIKTNDEYGIFCAANGAVDLYYDGSKKFETASDGVKLAADNSTLYIGADGDLRMWHNGTNSNLVNITGDLLVRSGGLHIQNAAGTETQAYFADDGAVDLYYDGSKKFETYAYGIKTTQNIMIGTHAYWEDSGEAIFGDDSDLKIYHSGADSVIDKTTDGNLLIYVHEDFYLKHGTEKMIAALDNGAVELYHDNSKKLETTTAGITVAGAVTETSDIALKTNIEPIDNVLDKIKQITGYTYQFKDTGHDSMGVTAQDVEKVFPELVHGKEGAKTLQYSGLIGALIESVKELSAKVAALESA